MNNELPTKEEKKAKRFFSLVIPRIIIVTLFLAITIFIDIKKQSFTISQITINFFYLIAAAVYLFSVIYILLFKIGKELKLNIYLQIAADIVIVTSLIFMFGNTQIDYSLFYTLIIIYSVIFIGRKGGMIVATISSVFYSLLLYFEFYRIMPFVSLVKLDYEINFADALTNVLVRIISFYILAFLTSFVVEQEKKAKIMLEERESAFNQLDLLFRSIIESVDTGVMTIDLKGRIKTFNRAAEDITGFKFRIIENNLLENIIPELVPLVEKEKFPETTRSRMSVEIKGEQGNHIHLGCSISPLKDRNEKQIGNIIIFQDLTEIKQMEESLEKNRRLALLGEMAAGIAHEMRNPLAAISGSIELLKQKMEFEGTNQRLMGIILRGKDQLESFVRDFLSLARPVPVKREWVDLNDVIGEVLEQIKISKLWNEKINIRKVLSDTSKVYANREQVRQILNNLVLNAVQAMEDGGFLSIETQNEILDDKKKYIRIIVSDTGCGIKEEDLNKIFDTFFTNKEKGIGLGLPIVNHIIEGYKGKIKIDSAANKGTNCFIWLPAGEE